MAIFTLFAATAFLCWLAFQTTVYAVPFALGVSAGAYAYRTGAGEVAAFGIGIAIGVLSWAMAQRLFLLAPNRSWRAALALLFALPAAYAGYHAALWIVGDSVAAPLWQNTLALAAALAVGATAAFRLANPRLE
jgi:hypothetical protein